jgi:hypothetical protein
MVAFRNYFIGGIYLVVYFNNLPLKFQQYLSSHNFSNSIIVFSLLNCIFTKKIAVSLCCSENFEPLHHEVLIKFQKVVLELWFETSVSSLWV